MTDEQILTKAIKKAIENGMEDDMPHSMFSFHYETWNWHNTIFSHDFAKYFFGEEVRNVGDTLTINKMKFEIVDNYLVWQYHLQQMVLEENPIKYLERFLDEE